MKYLFQKISQIKILHESHFNTATSVYYKDRNNLEQEVAKFIKDKNNFMKSSKVIREELADEFRKLIGVES